MENKIFKQVFVKSESDLPKEKCTVIYQNSSGIHTLEYENNANDKKYFLKYVNWYLIEVEDKPELQSELAIKDEIVKILVSQAVWSKKHGHDIILDIQFQLVAKKIASWLASQINTIQKNIK